MITSITRANKKQIRFLFHYASYQGLWEQEGLIQCGPKIELHSKGVQISSLNIKTIKDSLFKAGYKPQGVLIQYTDPFIMRSGGLKGLRNWNGPKLLVCGDLHHGPSPIDTLQQYQTREFHDSVVLTFNPILLEEVRIRLNVPVFCNPPGFFKYPIRVRDNYLKRQLLHIGNVGPYHTKRRELIERLISRQRIPLVHKTTEDAEGAADLYCRYALALNIPLNNDLNHRFYEIISAGAAQIIFGGQELLGPLNEFKDLKGIYWVNSINNIEQLVISLLKNPESIVYPNKPIPTPKLQQFLLDSFLYKN